MQSVFRKNENWQPLKFSKNLEVEQVYYVSGEFFFNGLTNKIEIWVKDKQMEITYPKKV